MTEPWRWGWQWHSAGTGMLPDPTFLIKLGFSLHIFLKKKSQFVKLSSSGPSWANEGARTTRWMRRSQHLGCLAVARYPTWAHVAAPMRVGHMGEEHLMATREVTKDTVHPQRDSPELTASSHQQQWSKGTPMEAAQQVARCQQTALCAALKGPYVPLRQRCQTWTIWAEIFHAGYLPQAEFFLESFRSNKSRQFQEGSLGKIQFSFCKKKNV